MRVLVSAMPVSRPAVATSRAELRPVPGLGREGRADQAAVKPCNPWQPDPAYGARTRGQGAGRQVALGRQGAGHAPDPDDRAVLRPLAREGALDPEPGRAPRARAARPDPQGPE